MARALEMQFTLPEPEACSRLTQEQSLTWGYNTQAEQTCSWCSSLLLGHDSAKSILNHLCWAVDWRYGAGVSSGWWAKVPPERERDRGGDFLQH